MRRKLAVCCDLWRTLRQPREMFSFNFQLFVSFLFGVFACSNSFTQEIFISNHSFFLIFFLFQTSAQGLGPLRNPHLRIPAEDAVNRRRLCTHGEDAPPAPRVRERGRPAQARV